MTIKSPSNLSFAWHLGNGLLGALLAVVGLFIVALILGFLTGQFGLIEKLVSPLLGFICCCTIILLAKRVACRYLPPDSSQRQFVFGVYFHVGNILIGLSLGFVLLFIPAIGIPLIDFSENMSLILVFSSMVIILIFIHTVASIRAAKHIAEKIN